jgi:hypothetical protein
MRVDRLILTLLVGGILFCGALAAAAAAFAPTPKELRIGLLAPSSHVPGLAYPTRPYGPLRTRPSLSTCVAAWNKTAPQAALRWIIKRSALAADVTLAELSVQQIGGTATSTAWTCVFGIAVSPTQLVYAVAPPKAADVWSGELLRYKAAPTLARLRARFNATVSENGFIRLAR